MKTTRLPTGLYVRRGRAVRFSDLSAAQRHAWRSHWSRKAAATRRSARAPGEAEEYLRERDVPENTARGMVADFGPQRVLSWRDWRAEAHRLWRRGKREEARALSDKVKRGLGEELSRVFKQLWWYH